MIGQITSQGFCVNWRAGSGGRGLERGCIQIIGGRGFTEGGGWGRRGSRGACCRVKCLLASGIGGTVPWLIVPVFGESSICCKELSTYTAKRLGGCNLGMCPHVFVAACKREFGQELIQQEAS